MLALSFALQLAENISYLLSPHEYAANFLLLYGKKKSSQNNRGCETDFAFLDQCKLYLPWRKLL